ncbi:hypothetical protein BGZ46_010122 [Entomortierella lignicola]|nr:hypothetical protein BGZ46_010122 [Entomortierella lignicola]
MKHLGRAASSCMEELVPGLGMSAVNIFDAMTSSSAELAVAALALAKEMVRMIQTATIGATPNNLLLIMSTSIYVRGVYHNQQETQANTSQPGINLLITICLSYVIPAVIDNPSSTF